MISLRALLPFWLAGPEARLAADALEDFWGRPESWLNQALAQADIATCSAAALAVHAADRSVDRLPGEAEALWRDRVRHAITVAIESGSLRGLESVLVLHGVLGAAVLERQPDNDWDMIEIRLESSALQGADTPLLDRIFHEWGRVCRRYAITHIEPMDVFGCAAPADELQHVETAT